MWRGAVYLERYSETLSHETNVTEKGTAWDQRADSDRGSILVNTALGKPGADLKLFDSHVQVDDEMLLRTRVYVRLGYNILGLIYEGGIGVAVEHRDEAYLQKVSISEIIETVKEKEGVFNMFPVKVFFHYLFTFPEGLLGTVPIGLLVGIGSPWLYLSRRLRHTAQQAWGQQVPRNIARSIQVSTLLSVIFVAGGLLLLFGILVGDFYFIPFRNLTSNIEMGKVR
ncbi:MAG TPA: hypothetical protein VF043_10580 [Ktedonobacteraceae bacterium]